LLRNLSDVWGWIERLIRRIDRLESGANLENSSITNGRMRFIGGILRLDSGALLELIGQWRFSGNGAITGDVVAEGKWTQNGTWEFNGNGKIYGDVEVLGGGRIRVGQIVLNPAVNGGTIEIGGHTIFASGNVLSITHSGGAQVVLNASGATLIGGGKSFSLQSTGASLTGLPTISRAAANNATIGSVYVDTSGQLYRVVL
jgi:hypothetical protein